MSVEYNVSVADGVLSDTPFKKNSKSNPVLKLNALNATESPTQIAGTASDEINAIMGLLMCTI